ncbi:MAG: transcriptional regulator [Cupriavidus sp.]|jgi:DNA-binding HxlR family transcriptional regulator|nr:MULTISPECIES: helix-turn-helix domain-containing protein [Cupriavidus]AMR78320.1 MarR family transcriptional regulator [Cupriavidus nantongensis]AZG14473.1 transcriptional regulator [Cupriavidus pauculus]KWW38090.1 putative HTH-type transcriptional regulator YtcD [Cupriavidus metallidurans]MBU67513.1 transcriptional regulator [Cupriavidus sp.]MBY4732164.1 helix-turn-helix transcriptional regulator [Cupriavidus pauculus]
MEKKTNGGDEINMHEEMRRAFALLSGKWKLEIMWLLNQRIYRFGELRKAIPGITQHMLTAQLRELEADGLISRTVFAEVPPRVEYEITAKARGLGATMEALTAWWNEYGRSVPAKPTSRGRRAKGS